MIRTSLFIAALLSASIAYAGDPGITLSVQNGTVLVNAGKQFVTAQAGQTLAPGDRILVMKGGKATLIYPDGCVRTIGSSSMAEVSAQCGKGIAQVQKVPPMYAQEMGGTSGTSDTSNCNSNDCDSANPTLWAVLAGWSAFTYAAIISRNPAGISAP